MSDLSLSGAELAAVAALWKQAGREVVARFSGGSMEPAIPSGAEVRLRAGDDPQVGDVVAFQRDGHLIVHRVVGRQAGWMLTRGDALVLPDPPIRDPAVLVGRVVAVGGPQGFAPPAAVRDRPARRLVLRACLGLLRASPAAGGALIRALRWLRPAAWEAWLDNRRAYAPVFVRLFAGTFLVYMSQDNVFSWARLREFEAFLRQHGFPLPLLCAVVSVAAQFTSGILFLAGAFVRWAALLMVVNFVVAIAMVHLRLPFREALDPAAMLACSLFLLVNGAGRPSVDARRRGRRA